MRLTRIMIISAAVLMTVGAASADFKVVLQHHQRRGLGLELVAQLERAAHGTALELDATSSSARAR